MERQLGLIRKAGFKPSDAIYRAARKERQKRNRSVRTRVRTGIYIPPVDKTWGAGEPLPVVMMPMPPPKILKAGGGSKIVDLFMKALKKLGPAASSVSRLAGRGLGLPQGYTVSQGIADSSGVTLDEAHRVMLNTLVVIPELPFALAAGAGDAVAEMIRGSGETFGLGNGLSPIYLLSSEGVAVYFNNRLLTVVSGPVFREMLSGMKREVRDRIRGRS